MRPTNPKPQLIYDFIAAYWNECGYTPSTGEIAAHVGLSLTTTGHYLDDLRERGAIDWMPNKVRTIRIVGEMK